MDPPSVSGSVSFVGEGRGESEQNARAAAYRSALERMGSDLGYDIVSSYYRELLNTDRIAELGSYIASSYSTFDNSGYYYYVLVITPSDSFDERRSEDIEKARGRDREIASLLSSASAHYRANEDVDALSDVLSALSLSLDGSLQHSPDDLMARAMAYLGNLELTASSAEDAICSVRMRRTRGPFHPMVRSGKVDAAYFMVDNAGDTIEDSVVAQTRQNGSFNFPATNPYMVRRGSIIFSIHLPEDTLAEIERKADEGFLDPLLSLRAEKSIVFDYVLPDRFPHAEALIAIVPFMRGDSPVYATETLEAFKGQLEAVGVGYDIVLAAGEDEGDILSRLRALYPEKRYLIISYLGVTDHREAFDGYYARVDGRSLIMDRDSLLVEQEIFASDGGESVEEAELNALEKGARIAAGMLLKDI